MTVHRPMFFVAAEDPPSKRKILEAALLLFVRDGICETSIRDIAVASGFSNPALYKFFGSKEELAQHLFEQCYLHLYTSIGAAFEKEGTFAQRLHRMVLRYAALLDESADAVLFVNENLRQFWPRAAPSTQRRSLLGLQMRLVKQGQREGVVSRDANTKLLVATMTGTMGQFARLLYFKEIAAPAVRWVPALERLLLRAGR